MKAMILAAGKGIRVRPLTFVVPKPMIPLLGRPVMEFVVDLLRFHGFTQIMVNTSYLAPQIEDYFRDGYRFGVDIGYSFEGSVDRDGALVDAPLGSAGGLRRIQDFSGFFDTTFAVLCGDAIIDVDLTAAVAAHRASGAVATLVAGPVKRDERSSSALAVVAPRRGTDTVRERPKPVVAGGALAGGGIYIFEPAIFDFIPSGEVFDIGSQLVPALVAAGASYSVVELPFESLDIGQTPDFWSATMKFLRGEIAGASIPGREQAPGIFTGINVSLPQDRSGLIGPIWIGGSASIADGARIIGPAAIGPGSVIEGGAIVERSVVWEYTRVTAHTVLRDQIVSGPYSVTSTGASVPLADAGLQWVLDDSRR